MKKLTSLLLTMVMVFTMTVTAFADTTYSITIDNSVAGHTYEAYQIFTGDLSEDKILSNIVWGDGVTEEGQTALQETYDVASAAELAKKLTSTSEAAAFAEEVVNYLVSANAKTSTYADNKYVISGLVAGYYLVKDKDGSLTDVKGEAYTDYILKVVKNVEMAPKSGRTTSEKKVDDVNDSNDTEDAIIWNDSADHDIGDKVSFKLTATIASDYANYKTYYLAFHDTEEKGLTFDPDSVEVYYGNGEEPEIEIDSTYYEVVTSTTDGHTFDVVFADLKEIEAITAGTVITVKYQSTLNENAVLGSLGNVNKMYAEYSNNPNDEQRGKTEEDTVIVFTYKVVVNKVDENNKALVGAEFTLEKKVIVDGAEKWVAIRKVETEAESIFEFKGLDDGEYRLTETATPAGYNSIDPIYFTVTADHDIVWTTQNREEVLNSLSAGKVKLGEIETTEITFTPNVGEGTLTTDIVNQSGATLPETGGMGTTLFYVIGAILVLGAGVVLVTKKRMA